VRADIAKCYAAFRLTEKRTITWLLRPLLVSRASWQSLFDWKMTYDGKWLMTWPRVGQRRELKIIRLHSPNFILLAPSTTTYYNVQSKIQHWFLPAPPPQEHQTLHQHIYSHPLRIFSHSYLTLTSSPFSMHLLILNNFYAVHQLGPNLTVWVWLGEPSHNLLTFSEN
jgi:hypothetical protein